MNMVRKKRTSIHTMVHITVHRKLKINQRQLHKTQRKNTDQISSSYNTSDILLFTHVKIRWSVINKEWRTVLWRLEKKTITLEVVIWTLTIETPGSIVSMLATTPVKDILVRNISFNIFYKQRYVFSISRCWRIVLHINRKFT